MDSFWSVTSLYVYVVVSQGLRPLLWGLRWILRDRTSLLVTHLEYLVFANGIWVGSIWVETSTVGSGVVTALSES